MRKGARYPKQFLQHEGDLTLREAQAVALGLTAFGATRTLPFSTEMYFVDEALFRSR